MVELNGVRAGIADEFTGIVFILNKADYGHEVLVDGEDLNELRRLFDRMRVRLEYLLKYDNGADASDLTGECVLGEASFGESDD
jgi:hypothetical protein